MSHQDVASSQAQSANENAFATKRHSANYAPCIWGDHFLSYASLEMDVKLEQRVQELKEEVKRMLIAPIDKSSSKLDMIDKIQRLGVSYHFTNEINEILKQIHKGMHSSSESLENDDDLYTTALSFRLFRQQGYNVSSDMFNKFKDSHGTFKESLESEVVGLLSLYEATYLRVHGEDILEEALTFTRAHLQSAAHSLSSPFSKQVAHALYQPLWRGFPRIEARHYISFYEEDGSYNETLLTFAKMDYNLLQKIHQKELSDATRWWKDLDFVNKLPFARDRIVESYIWALAVFFQPEYSFARMITFKYLALMAVLDDIYDLFGTYEELDIFTEAIERWEISVVDRSPKSMKVCYRALLDAYSGYEEQLAEEGNLYRIHYAREAIKISLRAYFKEAGWLKDKYTPATMDEYLSLQRNTSFFPMAITCFVGMGDIGTKDSMDWVLNDPKIMKAASVIGRLLNDMGGKVDSRIERGASAVECYMKQYGVTHKEAKIELKKQVNDEWKVINEELLDLQSNSDIPNPLLMIILNLTRSAEVIYKEGDKFTNSKTMMKEYVVSLVIEPVPV